MDPVAAKYIGAGIACIGMGGAGVGVASSSETTSQPRCAIPPRRKASSAT